MSQLHFHKTHNVKDFHNRCNDCLGLYKIWWRRYQGKDVVHLRCLIKRLDIHIPNEIVEKISEYLWLPGIFPTFALTDAYLDEFIPSKKTGLSFTKFSPELWFLDLK